MVGAVISLAVIFSASRMGIMSLFATLGFMGLMIRMRASQKRIATVMGFGLFGLILGGALWIGVDGILGRYGTLLEADAALREGRMIVYRDSLKMIADNSWGVGVDGYRDVFRQYQTFRPGLLFDHAHNDYLETAAEWGVVPAVAFWALVIGVLIQSIRTFLSVASPERRGILLASSGAIFAILVHSLTDFNLQILSNAMLFCIFVGIALTAISRIETGEGEGGRQ
jgi:putative inorganic carbon (HCO3(-)) transporter